MTSRYKSVRESGVYYQGQDGLWMRIPDEFAETLQWEALPPRRKRVRAPKKQDQEQEKS